MPAFAIFAAAVAMQPLKVGPEHSIVHDIPPSLVGEWSTDRGLCGERWGQYVLNLSSDRIQSAYEYEMNFDFGLVETLPATDGSQPGINFWGRFFYLDYRGVNSRDVTIRGSGTEIEMNISDHNKSGVQRKDGLPAVLHLVRC